MNELKSKDVNQKTVKFGYVKLGLSRSLELLPMNNKQVFRVRPSVNAFTRCRNNNNRIIILNQQERAMYDPCEAYALLRANI